MKEMLPEKVKESIGKKNCLVLSNDSQKQH